MRYAPTRSRPNHGSAKSHHRKFVANFTGAEKAKKKHGSTSIYDVRCLCEVPILRSDWYWWLGGVEVSLFVNGGLIYIPRSLLSREPRSVRTCILIFPRTRPLQISRILKVDRLAECVRTLKIGLLWPRVMLIKSQHETFPKPFRSKNEWYIWYNILPYRS